MAAKQPPKNVKVLAILRLRYWEEKKKYDFMDDADILKLTYATDDDLKTISEEESYKLRLLSKARKKEIDFYELLLDRNIPI